jgi:L,D-transpeptidase catalytic domain
MRVPAFSARATVLYGILALAFHASFAVASTIKAAHHHAVWRVHTVRAMPLVASSGWTVRPAAYEPEPPGAPLELSPAERRVSWIAARHGDRDFIMIDKERGRVILFANGAPVFSGAALTGASLADWLPPDALHKRFAEQSDVKYRVTPAGRFTLTPGYDAHYGTTLDLNEIKGPDWTIAIHLAPTEGRSARLRSPLDGDKHATEGCINVDADTMGVLVRSRSRRGPTPVYILPMDERLISAVF